MNPFSFLRRRLQKSDGSKRGNKKDWEVELLLPVNGLTPIVQFYKGYGGDRIVVTPVVIYNVEQLASELAKHVNLIQQTNNLSDAPKHSKDNDKEGIMPEEPIIPRFAIGERVSRKGADEYWAHCTVKGHRLIYNIVSDNGQITGGTAEDFEPERSAPLVWVPCLGEHLETCARQSPFKFLKRAKGVFFVPCPGDHRQLRDEATWERATLPK